MWVHSGVWSEGHCQGKVTDENNQPLPGAAVYIKGTGTGMLATDDGSFSIQVPDAKTSILAVNYTGYTAQEQPVNGAATINFKLVRSAVALKDVEAVSALGLNRSQKSLGYAQQGVDPERLTEARDVNIAGALAGKVAGLQVTTTGQLYGFCAHHYPGRQFHYRQQPAVVGSGWGAYRQLHGATDVTTWTMVTVQPISTRTILHPSMY